MKNLRWILIFIMISVIVLVSIYYSGLNTIFDGKYSSSFAIISLIPAVFATVIIALSLFIGFEKTDNDDA